MSENLLISFPHSRFFYIFVPKSASAMKIKEVIDALERFAPLPLQDGYDNAGLQLGLTEVEATGALLCLDITEEVLEEAESLGINLIVSHHPLLFRAIKSLTGRNSVERCVMKAICNGMAIYSAHTNLDNATKGVSFTMAEKIGLTDVRFLLPFVDGRLGGSGVIGYLNESAKETDFLRCLKKIFGAACVMHNRLCGREIQKVALCGGAGAFLIPEAIKAGADVFVTGEIKYHEFQGHDDDILLASLGHFESEQYTIELLEKIIKDAFSQLPVKRTRVNTNPIRYM